MAAVQLSVIIPAYNEEKLIAATVGKLLCALSAAGITFEIICINNCSKDATAAIVAALVQKDPRIILIETPPLQGYGIAVRTGLQNVAGDAIVIYMADGSDNPEDVVAYFNALHSGAYDCAFGSRFAKAGSLKGYPAIKLLLNRAGNFLLRLITGAPYNDFTNGFKCYKAEFLRQIEPFVSDQFNLTIEMSLKAVLAGARFIVVPNSWREREQGQSKFSILSQSFLYLKTLFEVLSERRLKQIASRAGRRKGRGLRHERS